MSDEPTKHGDRVKREILRMGLQLWLVDPAMVNARRIAHELNMTHSAVFYHFESADKLRNAIAYYAVKEGESRVIAQLIAQNHAAVKTMNVGERAEHMRAIC